MIDLLSAALQRDHPAFAPQIRQILFPLVEDVQPALSGGDLVGEERSAKDGSGSVPVPC